jgi:hypothetical protein
MQYTLYLMTLNTIHIDYFYNTIYLKLMRDNKNRLIFIYVIFDIKI